MVHNTAVLKKRCRYPIFRTYSESTTVLIAELKSRKRTIAAKCRATYLQQLRKIPIASFTGVRAN